MHTEFRIPRHVVASTYKAEVREIFHNRQTDAPLRITIKKLGSTQPPTPIKTDNSSAEGYHYFKKKRSKAMDIKFYWMQDRVRQKDSFVYWKPVSQKWGITSHNITHHTTIKKFVQHIYIRKTPY